MDIEAYLERIGYQGDREPTLATLNALHRAHLLALPYENLDIHLGRKVGLELEGIFDKIVHAGRGGWCFEMNGLFAWALRELGFQVSLLGGAVDRERRGPDAGMEHLLLLVALDRLYLADVGFGNGFLEPLALVAGSTTRGFLTYHLAWLDGDWWRYRHDHSGPSFDFTLKPYDLEDFASSCHRLQTAPESGFVRRTVCQRFVPGGVVTLRGAVFGRLSEAGLEERVIDTLDEYERVLTEVFGLSLKEAGALWAQVWPAHLAWRQALAAGEL